MTCDLNARESLTLRLLRAEWESAPDACRAPLLDRYRELAQQTTARPYRAYAALVREIVAERRVGHRPT